MIAAKLINSEATLNNYFPLDTIYYVPGDDVVVAFQIFNVQRDLRYVLPVGATVDVIYVDADGDEQTIAAVAIDALDRSLWKVTLTNAITADLGGSSLKIQVDLAGDNATLYSTIIQKALSAQLLSGDC